MFSFTLTKAYTSEGSVSNALEGRARRSVVWQHRAMPVKMMCGGGRLKVGVMQAFTQDFIFEVLNNINPLAKDDRTLTSNAQYYWRRSIAARRCPYR